MEVAVYVPLGEIRVKATPGPHPTPPPHVTTPRVRRRKVADFSERYGGDGVRLTIIQPHPDTSTITAKIGGFSEGLLLPLSECVPLRSHKTALLSGNSFGNAMPRRHWGGLGAGSVP